MSRGGRIVLSGELDGDETEALQAFFTDMVGDHPGRAIVLHADDLTFLDSSGIRALSTCQRRAEAAGGHLSISSISPIGFQVLQITGLLSLFGGPREAVG